MPRFYRVDLEIVRDGPPPSSESPKGAFTTRHVVATDEHAAKQKVRWKVAKELEVVSIWEKFSFESVTASEIGFSIRAFAPFAMRGFTFYRF